MLEVISSTPQRAPTSSRRIHDSPVLDQKTLATDQCGAGYCGLLIIGLDVGTTLAKAVLFDPVGQGPRGVELCVAEQAYQLHTPRPGWAELEPDDIWQAVVRVLREVAEQVPPGLQIQAIALATQGGTLIPCRADGTPTHRAITWLDGRSADLVARWRAEGVGDRVRRVSGWSPQPGLPLPSIGWLRRARPEVFAATERFLSVNDFLAQRLVGRTATNPSMAGEMLLTDVSTGEWSEELCSLVGIEPSQSSPILPSTEPLGQLRPGVSRLTGLAPGTLVVNGGQDHSCEALALGMTAAGAGLLACGTAWVINGVVESPAVDAIPPGMDLNSHVVPDLWVASQFLGGLGACLEWWLSQCGMGVQVGAQATHSDAPAPAQRTEARAVEQRRGGRDWDAFNAALEGTSPGCGGLLYLPQTGVRQGPGPLRHGGFLGLRLDHSRADMGRAILEGSAFELRWALEHLREAGLALEQMWMVGGAAKSPTWPQIVADVSGLPVLLSQYTHGPALGAAILAGVGLGIFDSVEAAQARFRVSAHRIEPEGTHAPVYDRQYAAYRRLAQEVAQ